MVSTHLQNISPNGNLPQIIGVKIKKHVKPPSSWNILPSLKLIKSPWNWAIPKGHFIFPHQFLGPMLVLGRVWGQIVIIQDHPSQTAWWFQNASFFTKHRWLHVLLSWQICLNKTFTVHISGGGSFVIFVLVGVFAGPGTHAISHKSFWRSWCCHLRPRGTGEFRWWKKNIQNGE